MVTKAELKTRVAELESDLRQRDDLIKELHDDLDRFRKLVDRKHLPISGNLFARASSPKPKPSPGDIDS